MLAEVKALSNYFASPVYNCLLFRDAFLCFCFTVPSSWGWKSADISNRNCSKACLSFHCGYTVYLFSVQHQIKCLHLAARNCLLNHSPVAAGEVGAPGGHYAHLLREEGACRVHLRCGSWDCGHWHHGKDGEDCISEIFTFMNRPSYRFRLLC